MKTALFCLAATAAASAAAAGAGRQTAKAVWRILSEEHISRKAPDDTISRRAWTNMLESCDGMRMTFLATDISRFKRRETMLDDMLAKGDLSFAIEARRTYLARLEERTAYATNFLARLSLRDFARGGEWTSVRQGADWPADAAEAGRLWEAKLRSDVLDEYLSCETGGVAKAAATVSGRLAAALGRERARAADAAEEDLVSSLAAAYDAHTVYLSPAAANLLDAGLTLGVCGIGAAWAPVGGGIRIDKIAPGGPLAKDGRIAAGDVIAAVSTKADGKFVPLAGVPVRDAASLFYGEKGSPVALEVEHSGGRRGTYTIMRDVVKSEDEAATASVVPGSGAGAPALGYLRLGSFYGARPFGDDAHPSSGADVAKKLLELAKADVGGILLDLRGNGGGSLYDAVIAASCFLRGGPAVQLAIRSGAIEVGVQPGMTVCETPVVVLVDSMSASASEMVSALLQDTGRAIVAGDCRTYGKGSTQSISDLSGEAESGAEGFLAVTDGKFYRITGSSTQFKGVEADIVLPSVPESDDREEKLEYPLPWDVIPAVPHEKAWDLDKFIPRLRAASAARRSASASWKEHERLARMAERSHGRKTFALGVDARRAQLAEENAVERETLRLREQGFDPANRKADPVLDEGLNILADLVRLNKGRTLPAARPPAAREDFLLDSLDD